MDFQLERVSSEDKNALDKMENSSLAMISDLARPLPFMEETFTFTIAMSTPDNSLR